MSKVGFDHSLVACMKALSLAVLPDELFPQILSLMVGLYMPVAAFAGTILYFDVIRKLPVINQVICLIGCDGSTAPVSYDYTLLHLYVPWTLLVCCQWRVAGAMWLV